MLGSLLRRLVVVLVLGIPPFSVAADDSLDRARRLLDARDPAGAYAVLGPLEGERAGQPDFDYLLGLAALDTGRYSEAVFAFERVLALRPAHAQARAELARALIALGDRDLARRELETVRAQDVPPEVTATIERFLDALDRLSEEEGTRLTGFLEYAFGHDSNVNAATFQDSFAIPALPQLGRLRFLGTAQDDVFWAFSGGASLRVPLRPRLALVAGGQLYKRMNSAQDRFDVGWGDGYAGLAYSRGADVYTLALQANNYYLDNDRFRDIQGAIAQWQHGFDAHSQGSAFFQYSDLHYPGQDIRDARRWAAGAAYARVFPVRLLPAIYLGGYGGHEDARQSGVPELGHHFYGLRLGGQLDLDRDLRIEAGVSVEQRRYGGAERLFLLTREDTQTDLRLALRWVPAEDWAITPQVGYTRNDSNVIISDYDRWLLALVVRREIR